MEVYLIFQHSLKENSLKKYVHKIMAKAFLH